MNIKSLKRLKTECTVYDIEVEKDHSFIVQGCVLHNCILCASLDGKLYKTLEEAQPVVKHRGCRCLLLPYFDIEGETRSSPQEYISSKITFEDWLKEQDAATQKDVLGVARYKLFNEGTSMNQFVDNGKVLNLKQLYEKLGIEE